MQITTELYFYDLFLHFIDGATFAGGVFFCAFVFAMFFKPKEETPSINLSDIQDRKRPQKAEEEYYCVKTIKTDLTSYQMMQHPLGDRKILCITLLHIGSNIPIKEYTSEKDFTSFNGLSSEEVEEMKIFLEGGNKQ